MALNWKYKEHRVYIQESVIHLNIVPGSMLSDYYVPL